MMKPALSTIKPVPVPFPGPRSSGPKSKNSGGIPGMAGIGGRCCRPRVCVTGAVLTAILTTAGSSFSAIWAKVFDSDTGSGMAIAAAFCSKVAFAPPVTTVPMMTPIPRVKAMMPRKSNRLLFILKLLVNAWQNGLGCQLYRGTREVLDALILDLFCASRLHPQLDQALRGSCQGAVLLTKGKSDQIFSCRRIPEKTACRHRSDSHVFNKEARELHIVGKAMPLA